VPGLGALLWFMLQSVTVGGLGVPFFLAPFLALVAGLYFTWKKIAGDRGRLWVLLVLPAIWILVGLLGGSYWVDWQATPVQTAPAWVKFLVNYGIFAFLIAAAAIIFYLKGARWFAFIWFLMNLYFMLSMTLLAGMAVTGVWL
jgi:hypothetical protein